MTSAHKKILLQDQILSSDFSMMLKYSSSSKIEFRTVWLWHTRNSPMVSLLLTSSSSFFFLVGWLAGWVMICLVQVLVIWMGWLWIGKDWLVGCIWVRFVISGSVYGYWDRFVSYMDWKLRNYTAWEPRTPRNSMSAYLLSNSINDGWSWTNDDCCSSDW